MGLCHEQCLTYVPILHVIFAFNLIAATKDYAYLYAGQIMAMSIAHGGQSPCFLSELLYECLEMGPDNVKVKTKHITDEETRSQVQLVGIVFSYKLFVLHAFFNIKVNRKANSCMSSSFCYFNDFRF